ncbi:AAA family ATPase [Oscillatoria sp. FACHB-1406]|uniref:AAA family ATPase n=1 Tax=Oscillatoria sp. FACHB-1406 TaxID=2692846 RepID=UPI0016837D40|nr:ATP-binding protein [Oscillatoria sp. FACHB-1406]
MTEKLTINNFAGIKELKIEVKRVNILIGPQASGKSICAKLLFYFKSFVWEIVSVIENEKTKRTLDSNYARVFQEFFPPESWGEGVFSIKYEIEDVFIAIERDAHNKEKVCVIYSDFFQKELSSLRRFFKLNRQIKEDSEVQYRDFDVFFRTQQLLRDRLVTSLSNTIGEEAAFLQLFIPAGRSFFANLQSNIFSFLSSNNAVDPFLRNFGSIYENIKYIESKTSNSIEKKERKDIQEEISSLIESSLCGKHLRVKGQDFLESKDGRRINVANSSSGQQEILPLTIMLPALIFLVESAPGRTVYIEEPEAHLFPKAQRNIVELISTVFNARNDKLQFFITTHSPYVLTAFNNLLQAGLLYQEKDESIHERLGKIVPRYKSLNVDHLSAYVLIDGSGSSIICPETKLIDAQIIDSVSDDLAIEFDKLLDFT